jgi:hypothetical protein
MQPKEKTMRKAKVVCEMVGTTDDIFIVRNGVKIAKRGHPGTPQAKTWVSLEPGWRVLDGKGPDGKPELVVEYNSVWLQ